MPDSGGLHTRFLVGLMKKLETPLTPISKKANRSHLATAGGFGAILLWSMTIAVARHLSEQLGPVTAATAVYSVSSVMALGALLRPRRRRQVFRMPTRYLLGCGALFVGYMLLLYLAVGGAANRQQVLEVGLLNYLWPALTLLLSLVFLGKKANWVLVPGTLLALTGVFLVITQGTTVSWQFFAGNLASNPAAYGLALAAAVCWAVYSNLTHRWAAGEKEGGVVLFLPMTAIVLLLIGCFLSEPREWNRRSLVAALFLGVATYLAYTLWDHAMRRGNIVLVAAASYLTPLFSTIVNCFYLDVLPGTRLWVGCSVLIIGSVLSWRSISSDSPGERAQSGADPP